MAWRTNLAYCEWNVAYGTTMQESHKLHDSRTSLNRRFCAAPLFFSATERGGWILMQAIKQATIQNGRMKCELIHCCCLVWSSKNMAVFGWTAQPVLAPITHTQNTGFRCRLFLVGHDKFHSWAVICCSLCICMRAAHHLSNLVNFPHHTSAPLVRIFIRL